MQRHRVAAADAWRRLRSLGLPLLALAGALLLVKPIMQLPDHVERDFNEGWNALQAEKVVNGERLYPAYSAVTANIYPPLSFYVIAPVGDVLGDHVIAGRLMALLSLLVSAAAVGVIVREATSSTLAATGAGVTVVAYMAARHGGYVAMNDPQWLGHALMLSGAACLMRARTAGAALYLGCLLMVAGGFVKHTLICLPFAATAWILLERRGWFLRWTAAGTTLVVVGLSVATLTYGQDFMAQLFSDSRTYDLRSLATGIDRWFTPMLPLIILAGFAVPALLRCEPGRFILLYCLVSIPWGAFLLVGNGVDHNAVFDAVLALSMAIGVLMHQSPFVAGGEPQSARRTAGVVALCLVVTIAPRMPRYLGDVWLFSQSRPALEATSRADIEFLASTEGPAACENLALCYWAGKGFEFDFFHTAEKTRTGVMDAAAVSGLFASRAYAVVQLESADGSSIRLPQSALDALHANYEVARTSEVWGSLYIPR